nr:hypothetical protein GCM10020185_87520 [Pseudomonas brassicacearum subsp. brassicacearum]
MRKVLDGALAEYRDTILANATLLPLRDAVVSILRPEGSQAKRSLSIALSESRSGDILPDEGFFGYGFNKKISFFYPRCFGYFYTLASPTKTLNKVKLSSAPQAEHRRLLRMQQGIFSASLAVIGGVQDSYADFIELFKESPFIELIESKFTESDQTNDELDISVEK